MATHSTWNDIAVTHSSRGTMKFSDQRVCKLKKSYLPRFFNVEWFKLIGILYVESVSNSEKLSTNGPGHVLACNGQTKLP